MFVSEAHHDALRDFEEWVIATATDDLSYVKRETPSLANYIQDWMHSGFGVYACHGNFEFYLTVVILIINEWSTPGTCHGRNLELNYIEDLTEGGTKEVEEGSEDRMHERHVDAIFGDEGSMDAAILDRHFFDRCAFRTVHGYRRKS